MDKREQTRITVYRGEGYSGMPPRELPEFLEWLNGIVAEIPEEYRPSATVEIRSETDYDYHSPVIEIEYCRPETDEEMAQRIEKRNAYMAREEAREIDILQKLQQKYAGRK